MGYQVLARKWRPSRFEDVIGQEHITQSLKNGISKSTVGHAYLFTGTRGIGKTTLARIFAKALRCSNLNNGNPCNQCENCHEIDAGHSIDVTEIDGASHNSVENIRQLVENIAYLPAKGKYRVYIIDEVHMLSVSAFNALLKTLEEPPEHVVFIFATTEPAKVLGTILSRCQRYDLKNASINDLTQLLGKISKAEELQVNGNQIWDTLAKEANGSFRDCLSLLDRVLSYSIDKTINEEIVAQALGLAKLSATKQLFESTVLGDVRTCTTLYQTLIHENISVENIIKAYQTAIYETICYLENIPGYDQFIWLDKGYLEKVSVAEFMWLYETLNKDLESILKSIDPSKALHLVFLKMCKRREFFQLDTIKVQKAEMPEVKVVETKKIQDQESKIDQVEVLENPINEPIEEVSVGEKAQAEEPSKVEMKSAKDITWDDFVASVRLSNPVLGTNLEQGNIIEKNEGQDNSLSIRLGFGPTEKVFGEYISQRETSQKVIKQLSQYTSRSEDKIRLEIKIFEKGDPQLEKFDNLANQIHRDEKDRLKTQEDELVQSPLIQEAQKVFSSKVDKVLIN